MVKSHEQYLAEVNVLFGGKSNLSKKHALPSQKEAKGGSTEASIQALQDTDYRDASAYFKMIQLLKGLASVADEDEMANSFLSAVSDALSDIVWDETDDEGDGEEDEGEMEESSVSLGDDLFAFAQGKKKLNETSGVHVPDAFKTVQVGSMISYNTKAFPRIKGAPTFKVTKVDARRRIIYGVDKSGRPVELEYDGGSSDTYTLRIQGDVSKKMKPAFAIKPFAIRVEDIKLQKWAPILIGEGEEDEGDMEESTSKDPKMKITTKKMEKIAKDFDMGLSVDRETTYPDGFDRKGKRQLVYRLSAKGRGPTVSGEQNREDAVYRHFKDMGMQVQRRVPGGVTVWGS